MCWMLEVGNSNNGRLCSPLQADHIAFDQDFQGALVHVQ